MNIITLEQLFEVSREKTKNIAYVTLKIRLGGLCIHQDMLENVVHTLYLQCGGNEKGIDTHGNEFEYSVSYKIRYLKKQKNNSMSRFYGFLEENPNYMEYFQRDIEDAERWVVFRNNILHQFSNMVDFKSFNNDIDDISNEVKNIRKELKVRKTIKNLNEYAHEFKIFCKNSGNV